jgi:RecF/RecN/SMC N terminal domain
VFAEAFADVNEHFGNLVTTLFPGGTGRLSLTEPEDLLNTGVEVEVRPAGRNVRRLSLLSGGERSLVALAYLFAVFRSRPSPFYLMDEVEAALDDVNLQRFLGLVHEFRAEAQLIVVSHQKRTMEAADALYGVTMAPGGSSKVVSQKVPRRPDADGADPGAAVVVSTQGPEGTSGTGPSSPSPSTPNASVSPSSGSSFSPASSPPSPISSPPSPTASPPASSPSPVPAGSGESTGIGVPTGAGSPRGEALPGVPSAPTEQGAPVGGARSLADGVTGTNPMVRAPADPAGGGV